MKDLVCRMAVALALCSTGLPALSQAQAAESATSPDPAEEKARLKAEEKARLKAEKEAAKAKAAQLREWKALYGPGPYPDELEAYAANKPEALREYYKVLYADGEHNAVLNLQRLGLLALEKGLYTDAERAFDLALLRIEAFYSRDKQASKADNLTQLEVNKDYKGESYERAMAYYYRGLLYLRVGDYDNARASFKSAEYQDTVSEAEEFKSDFALLNYLSAWASHCAGDKSLAEDAFTAAAAIDPTLVAPLPELNTLIIAELGHGPRKVTRGQYNEALGFEPSLDAENGAEVTLVDGSAEKTLKLLPAANLYTQASTRGGRAIDSILNGKAQWKSGLQTTGNAMMQAGMMSYASGNDSAGAIGMLGGLAMGLFSSAVRPTADIRNWDTLPGQVMIATEQVKNNQLSAKYQYLQANTPLDIAGVTPMTAVGKCSIIWSRSASVAGAMASAPGDNKKIAAKRKKDASAWQTDQKFRSALMSQ